MQPHTRTPSTWKIWMLIGMSALILVSSMPPASAGLGPLGDVQESGWSISVLVIAILVLISPLFPPVRSIFRAFRAGAITTGVVPIVFGIGLLLVVAAITPGGMLHPASAGAPAATVPGSSSPATFMVGSSGPYNAALHEPTSDVTVQFADASTNAALSPTSVSAYKPAVVEKGVFEGSTRAERGPVAASSGSATLSGVQVQEIGCVIDVGTDLANYYEHIERNLGVCVEKNPLRTNDWTTKTVYLKKIGTLSLSTVSPSSLTCTAGTQCSYPLRLANTAGDTYLKAPAVKFTNVDSASLDSVDPGAQCEIVEVSSTQYVVFTGSQAELGPLGTATCPLKITRASGDTDGSFNWTADDLFQVYGSTAWNTNSNIRGAAATSAYTVSFA